MEENEVIKEINEEAVSTVCESVSNSNGNVFVKLTVAALVAAAGVGTVLFIKKRKARKTETVEVINESDMVIDNDEIEE